ncbi:MAG: 6-carboxytetrahydropterin synthase [Pseudomonadota bacterium]
MQRMTTIEIRKQYLHFSAAHFTIFSATERERLHGHNWRVSASITGPVQYDGLCFDYAVYKELLKKLCAQYDEYTLLPEFSPFLTIEDQGDSILATHNEVTMSFLKTDALILPVRNITIEELSDYLLKQMLKSKDTLDKHEISNIVLGVSSGPDQWAYSEWQR